MKALIYLLFSTTLISSVFAQSIEKGDKFFGIQTNLVSADLYYTYFDLNLSKNEKRAGFHIAPTIQWALEKNFILGSALHVGYNSEKYNYGFPNSIEKFTSFDIGLNAFTRYYIDILKNKKLKIFGLAGVHLLYTDGESKYSNSSLNNTYNDWITSGSFGFGLAYASKKGMIDLNFSNAGLFLGFHKKLGKN